MISTRKKPAMNAVPIDPSATVDSLVTKGGPPRSSAEGSSDLRGILRPKATNLIGRSFGRLTVVSFGGYRDHRLFWKCKCSCGGEKLVRSDALMRGSVTSCGCLPRCPHLKDLTGLRVGKLTVLHPGPRSNQGRTRWLCQCDCGNTTLVNTDRLLSKDTRARGGRTRSCGCLQSETVRANIGPLNANWKPELAPEARLRKRREWAGSVQWAEVAKRIRTRDGRRCTVCDSGCCMLHTHHLEPWAVDPAVRYVPENLVTICRTCHELFHQIYGGDAGLDEFEEFLHDFKEKK